MEITEPRKPTLRGHLNEMHTLKEAEGHVASLTFHITDCT